jgi:hypothetical protein
MEGNKRKCDQHGGPGELKLLNIAQKPEDFEVTQ